MKWSSVYELFLFDFDGLLVNTEMLHFQAYQRLCHAHGQDLSWDFDEYCHIAHHHADALRMALFTQYPKLFQDASWVDLYAEKKRHYFAILQEKPIPLMAGVEQLLNLLERENIPRAVVTHSPAEQIILIRNQNPVLNKIPVWFTREFYHNPKPAPDGYIKAIEAMKGHGKKVIGFEDTPRGFQALQGSGADPILVCEKQAPSAQQLIASGVNHYENFHEILERHF